MINLLTEKDNQTGIPSSTTCDWHITNAPNFPITLTVNGISGSYVQDQFIGIGNPSVILPNGNFEFEYRCIDCVPFNNISTLNIFYYNQLNDDCTGAFTLQVPNTPGQSGTNNNLVYTECTTNSSVPAPPGWPPTFFGDIWFTFTPSTFPGAPNNLSFTIIGLNEPGIALYSNNCSAPVLMNNWYGTSTTLVTTATFLVPGQQYWLRVTTTDNTQFPATFNLNINS